MLARLKRWFLPQRVSEQPATAAFHDRLRDARRYGVEQKRAPHQAVRELRESRDISQSFAPPPWRGKAKP
jgi:hypothetical protein